jgi:F-type H+-transporting ATPase subunit b
MPIDWFTVAAQILNFLILVWLLKRFLYRPILNAMAERERRTRETVESAEREKAGAERERSDWQARNAAFEQERQNRLAAATHSAEEERVRLTEAARTEAQNLRAKWHESLVSEQTAFREAFTRRAQEAVIDIARQALRDLGGAELEERIAQVFIARLQNIDGDERQRIAALVQGSHAGAIVRSAAPLQPETQQQIETAVHAALGAALLIRFETQDGLAAGIELRLNGYKVGWTLDNYLGALRESAQRLLAEEATDERLP